MEDVWRVCVRCVTGNAYQTVKVTDAVKIVTIRGTAFDAAATEGGSAATEEGESTCLYSNKVPY